MAKQTGKMPSQRQLRVGEELRHAIADLLRREEFYLEPLATTAVTVSEVSLSPDLKNARVFVSPLGGGDSKDMLDALNELSPHIRQLLGRKVYLKYVPRLSFRLDTSFDEAERVAKLLQNPAVKRDLEPSS